MGCPDSVYVPCPKCGTESEFQSKGDDGGACRGYKLADAPAAVLSDVNRHSPNQCEKCGIWFDVEAKIEYTVIDRRVFEVPPPCLCYEWEGKTVSTRCPVHKNQEQSS